MANRVAEKITARVVAALVRSFGYALHAPPSGSAMFSNNKCVIIESREYRDCTYNGCVYRPAAGVIVSADFEFDVPVRFDTDTLVARADGPGIFVWDSIPVVELRV